MTRSASQTRRGLTLLETLAALAIFSLVSTVGGAWIISASRAAQSTAAAARESTILAPTLDAIRADLIEAAPKSIEFDSELHEIRMTTARRAPGADHGWRRATWRLTDESIIRSERLLGNDADSELEQVIVNGVESFIISCVESSGGDPNAVIVTITLGLASGASNQCVWRLEP